jgi:hypothetical protein
VKHCVYLSNFNYCRIKIRKEKHASCVTTDGSFTYQIGTRLADGSHVGAESTGKCSKKWN